MCVDEAEAMACRSFSGGRAQILAFAGAKFGADSDFTSVAKVVEEWARVEIRG
jgi:hypothetical protein